MGKRKRKNHTIPTQRIIIQLAGRIQSGETTAKQELDAGTDAWIYKILRENLEGYNQDMRPDQRSHLMEIVKKILTPGKPFHDYLSQVLDKMTNGKTEQQLLEEFDEAHKPTPRVPKAPAGANVDHAAPPNSKEEDEEENEEDMLVVTAPAETKKPSSRPNYIPVENKRKEALVVFSNATPGYDGRSRLVENCAIMAWLNLHVHILVTQPKQLYNSLIKEYTSPRVVRLFAELDRSRGVITIEVDRFRDKYVHCLRAIKDSQKRERRLRRDLPSSSCSRTRYCKGCKFYVEKNAKLAMETDYWDKLRASSPNRTYEEEFLCTQCNQKVLGEESWALLPTVLAINIPKFKEDGKSLYHDSSYHKFSDQFPTEATLGKVRYQRLYSIITITLVYNGETPRHRVVLHDPPEGGEQEVIDCNKSTVLSTKISELDYSVEENFVHVSKVLYKRLPGASRNSDLKYYQQHRDEAASEDDGAVSSRLRPR